LNESKLKSEDSVSRYFGSRRSTTAAETFRSESLDRNVKDYSKNLINSRIQQTNKVPSNIQLKQSFKIST